MTFTLLSLSLLEGERGVGEYRVVAPGREQLALPGGCLGVEVFDPADDQPGGDGLALLGGERGIGDLGDLGVGDPAPQLVIPDRPRVLDRRPGVLADRSDRGLDRRVQLRRDRENAPAWRTAWQVAAL
jgi:hypothetical protein